MGKPKYILKRLYGSCTSVIADLLLQNYNLLDMEIGRSKKRDTEGL